MELGRHMVAKTPRHIHHGTRVQSIRSARHREGGTKAHAYSHTGRMEVSSLIVIESIHASRGRSVIPWWLIGKIAERERVWIEERRREAPWLILRFRRRVKILYFFMTICGLTVHEAQKSVLSGVVFGSSRMFHIPA